MNPLFMLDTDSVSFALRGEGRVAERILSRRPSELCISSITLGELRYGAAKRASSRLDQLIDTFAANVSVVPFDEAAANQYGILAAKLTARGAPIGDFDVLIAAHAMAAEAVLVSNNTRHFSRVEGLKVENWR